MASGGALDAARASLTAHRGTSVNVRDIPGYRGSVASYVIRTARYGQATATATATANSDVHTTRVLPRIASAYALTLEWQHARIVKAVIT